jgi:hypothetical protein
MVLAFVSGRTVVSLQGDGIAAPGLTPRSTRTVMWSEQRITR